MQGIRIGVRVFDHGLGDGTSQRPLLVDTATFPQMDDDEWPERPFRSLFVMTEMLSHIRPVTIVVDVRCRTTLSYSDAVVCATTPTTQRTDPKADAYGTRDERR